MTQAQHYKFQADQAKRLARQVTDSEVRERLLEMAGEYSRYAELMEARERPARTGRGLILSPSHRGQELFSQPACWNRTLTPRVLFPSEELMEANMGRGILLWLLGVPIPVIILLWLFFGR